MPDHVARLAQAIDRWNAGDLDGYLTLYDDGIRLHGFAPEPLDKPAVTGLYQAMWASLPAEGEPNPELVLHDVVREGDLVACRFSMSGTQTGEFMGAAATGRPYRLEGMTMLRFQGDRVVERWSTADFLSMLTQLGAMPAMA